MDKTRKSVRFEPVNASEDQILGTSVELALTHEAFTPKITRVQYKNPQERPKSALAPASSLSRPNSEDILKRVSIVIHTHIEKCEKRLSVATPDTYETGKFHTSKMLAFSEENFLSPQYVYHFVRQPIVRLGFLYGIRKVAPQYETPSLETVHKFLNDLFFNAQLSPECSIVCLIYVERLMELGNVPLVGTTWRPLLLCGLLLASKVWQDLSSWNIEISEIYPQYSLQSINKLERMFCQEINWDLYISSSVYAKYYFALRSLAEKKDFRRNYNVMVLNAPGAEQIAERSVGIKESFLMSMSL
jgi:hypothetical protein